MNLEYEIRLVRHRLHFNHTYYSFQRIDPDGNLTPHFWAPTPEKLQELIKGAIEKPILDYKV